MTYPSLMMKPRSIKAWDEAQAILDDPKSPEPLRMSAMKVHELLTAVYTPLPNGTFKPRFQRQEDR